MCPTPYQALLVRCPNCLSGCSSCTDGTIEVTSCIWELVDRPSIQMVDWVQRFERHGVLPMAGGFIDQTRSFLDALDLLSPRIEMAKARLGITS